MEHASDVARYLDSAAYRLTKAEPKPAFGHGPFVTISREVGADGHALAEALLDALARRGGTAFEGWQVFDRALFAMIAEEPRLKVSMRYLLDEEYHSRMTDYLEQTLGSWTPQDVLQAKIFRYARALAGAGKVIIVGRGAACATADLAGGIHVRLVASLQRRLLALQRRTGLDEKRARKRLEELEEARRLLVRAHFGRDISDPLLYDAVFNEDRLPTSEIASWIAGEVEKKAHLLDHAAKRDSARTGNA
jgi:hypothetical protein